MRRPPQSPQGLGEPGRILAQVQPDGAEAKRLGGEAQRTDKVLSEAAAAAFGQRLLGHREIGDELVGVGVMRRGRPLAFAARQRGFDLAVRADQKLPIGLAGVAQRDLVARAAFSQGAAQRFAKSRGRGQGALGDR